MFSVILFLPVSLFLICEFRNVYLKSLHGRRGFKAAVPKLSWKKHLLQYVYTALTKPAGFSGPEFSAVGLYDDRRISHYSNEEQTWKRDSQNSDIWRDTEEPDESRDRFIDLVNTLANCTRAKCDDLHTLQRRIGCEKDAVMNVTAFDEYRYDGEDFIVFNYDTIQWMEKNPKAKETKMKWNKQTHRNHYLQSYLKTCMNWISTFNHSISNAPDVHMFASEARHDRSELNLTCLATGFYPKHIEMKITLNNRNLEPFNSTGVRPNEDKTFQMGISVEIHRDEKQCIECHVSHSSQTNKTSWDGNYNCSEESRWHYLAAVAAAVFAAVVAVLSILSIIYKRRKLNGRGRAEWKWSKAGGENVNNPHLCDTLVLSPMEELQKDERRSDDQRCTECLKTILE
ncbi:major histocompatibility complex class I-related gene protein-like isoform X3 [Ctenopharyngodon idella]|uniref:major histocompatibility complex class I-related gene protein-like isoform X3 n=1 Tax=Ctenopharyngodon idella TaxID=7959 RepID=UPI002232C0E4|nr:major histocompatibility complex class I-related gene protein-like isoform X3 [Ctenopharyngodon idella]